MKKILSLICILFFFSYCKAQVPTGVPQLFGGRYYQFPHYVRIDEGVLFGTNDTLFTPILPAVVFRTADSTLYLWNRLHWVKVGSGGNGGGTFKKAGGGVTNLGDSLYADIPYIRGQFFSVNPVTFNSATGAIGVNRALADGTSVGVAAFLANDFNDNGSGLISIDYTNAQKSTSLTNGILSSTDWVTFNNKETLLTFSSPMSRATNTISIGKAQANSSTLGVSTYTTNDFNDDGLGKISLDYINGQKATFSQPGFLSATDYTNFTMADSVVVTNAGSGGFGIIFASASGDTLFGKKFRAGSNVSITQGSDSSLTIAVTAAGITQLNGLGASTQTFATGTSGSDFNISSVTSTHTFNIPSASKTARGLITTGTQDIGGRKNFDTVSIGSTAPPANTMLYIEKTTNAVPAIWIQHTGSANALIRGGTDSRSFSWGVNWSGDANAGNFEIKDITGGNASRLRINTSGNVVIPDLTGTGTRIVTASSVGLLASSTFNSFLPTQTGNAGKFIQTDGAGNLSWQPGGGSLDAVLSAGNFTSRTIIDTSTVKPDAFDGWRGYPTGKDSVYAGHTVGYFRALGWATFYHVNSDDRPNIVGNIFSYNADESGGRINSNEASYRFAGETNYDLASISSFEFHLPEITTASGSVIRPLSMYARKSTGYTEMNMAVPSVSYIDYQNPSRVWMSFTDNTSLSVIQMFPIANGNASIIMGGSSVTSGVNHDFTLTNDGHTVTLNHNETTASLAVNMRTVIGGAGTAGSNYKTLDVYGYSSMNLPEVDATPLTINKGAGGTDILTLQEAGASRYLFNPGYLRIAMTTPKLQFYNASGGTDAKMWIHEVSGNDEYFRTYDDGVANPVDILRFNRTGTTANYVAVPNAEMYIGSTTDQGAYSLQNTGNMYNSGNYYTAKHYTSLQTLTSSTAGSGAGTGPTLTVTGGDVSGKIVLLTGTSPASAGNLVVITFLNAYAAAPNVVLTPGSSSAAALSGTSAPYISAVSTTQFVFTAGSTALAATSSYTWYYQVLH